MKYASIFTAVGLACAAPLAQASDFDGSKPLICAPVEAYECIPEADCAAGTPREIGAPSFLRIDVKKKTVRGVQRETNVTDVLETETQILMFGTELGFGWTIALDRESGSVTVNMSSSDGSVVLFGTCTPA